MTTLDVSELTQVDVAKSNKFNFRYTRWTFKKYCWLNEEQKYFMCKVFNGYIM